MYLSLLPLLTLPLLASAQFGNFFEGMFGGGQQQQQQQQRGQNVASDSQWYQNTYDGASCSNYLCPGTLACVDKPTHCPCAWPDVEEKFELDPDGMAICVSKSGAEGMTKLKVELARKGLL
ncbi:uncharacterized protein LAJ45_04727 [Morchella importuna]|uniref:Long chronological lifespan protein 2 n=1 Tax=Morchella conica CCBAS932 TaxID=1392247 RepID=A0A3N4KGF1_9PEZI|nr:uncharacterized protein LAJ45_04727 [Morchella importuna]KAH8151026.1 hypothetical protein LAJ45_04727 [Morchella importuna]RPB08439.1 hypothetical protein P167DRAFT_539248 [Morchella conica CCBAS932]